MQRQAQDRVSVAVLKNGFKSSVRLGIFTSGFMSVWSLLLSDFMNQVSWVDSFNLEKNFYFLDLSQQWYLCIEEKPDFMTSHLVDVSFCKWLFFTCASVIPYNSESCYFCNRSSPTFSRNWIKWIVFKKTLHLNWLSWVIGFSLWALFLITRGQLLYVFLGMVLVTSLSGSDKLHSIPSS